MRYDSSRAIIKIQETNNGINAYSNRQSRNPLRSEYFRDSLPKLFSPVFLFKQNTSYKKHYVKYGNLLYRSIEFCFRISMKGIFLNLVETEELVICITTNTIKHPNEVTHRNARCPFSKLK